LLNNPFSDAADSRWYARSLAFALRPKAILVPVLAIGLLWSLTLAAATKRKAVQSRPRTIVSSSKKAKRAGSIRTSSHSRRRRTPRRTDYQRRMARIHLESQRVQEIQRALSQAGYLHQEPNGTWDSDTRAAMERYQQGNGFSPTGLPDARSLMKLGLGPHPLPAAADPKTTAESTLPGSTATPSSEQEQPN
jgi:peptidoglycan hydrolase-like protein with peptidoglycan-binding domain